MSRVWARLRAQGMGDDGLGEGVGILRFEDEFLGVVGGERSRKRCFEMRDRKERWKVTGRWRR